MPRLGLTMVEGTVVEWRAKPGDDLQKGQILLVIESEKVGTKTREGVILEVIEHPYGTEYRIRWDDGRETSIRPSAGSARIVARSSKKAG